jgi:hypothetical protein
MNIFAWYLFFYPEIIFLVVDFFLIYIHKTIMKSETMGVRKGVSSILGAEIEPYRAENNLYNCSSLQLSCFTLKPRSNILMLKVIRIQ